MANCVCCGRGAESGEYLCAACLRQAEAIHFVDVESEDAGIPLDQVPARDAYDCPRCRVKLHFLVHGGAYVEQCPDCRGLWYSREAFQDAVDATPVRVFDARQTQHLRQATRKIFLNDNPQKDRIGCLECAEPMFLTNFGKASGIVIDVCGTHGIWFDASELERILAFIANGGLEMPEFVHLLSQSGETDETFLPRFRYRLQSFKSLQRATDKRVFSALIIGSLV